MIMEICYILGLLCRDAIPMAGPVAQGMFRAVSYRPEGVWESKTLIVSISGCVTEAQWLKKKTNKPTTKNHLEIPDLDCLKWAPKQYEKWVVHVPINGNRVQREGGC